MILVVLVEAICSVVIRFRVTLSLMVSLWIRVRDLVRASLEVVRCPELIDILASIIVP